MVHVCMKYRQIILSGSKVIARTSKYCIWPLTLNCDRDLGVRVMKVVRDTPSSDGACVYEKLWPVQAKTVFDLWPLTLNCDLDVRIMKAERDTPSSDGACVYEVSSKLSWADQKLWLGQTNTVFDLWPWAVTLTLQWGSWKRDATLRLVMVHVCMKYC
jgi:hypothetical protein